MALLAPTCPWPADAYGSGTSGSICGSVLEALALLSLPHWIAGSGRARGCYWGGSSQEGHLWLSGQQWPPCSLKRGGGAGREGLTESQLKFQIGSKCWVGVGTPTAGHQSQNRGMLNRCGCSSSLAPRHRPQPHQLCLGTTGPDGRWLLVLATGWWRAGGAAKTAFCHSTLH